MEEKKVLIIEDEAKIARFTELELKHEGYEVFVARDGREGLDAFSDFKPDIILLDLMLPQLSGIEVCRRIRKDSNVPIIMLTAKGEVMDKVMGLDSGADDYVTKPFGNRELIARVKAHLRRSEANKNIVHIKNGNALSENTEQFGEITIDFDRYEVYKRGEAIELTNREYDLLKFLAQKQPQIFTREALLEQVWGYEYLGDVRAVDVTIRRLREKVEDDASKPKFIMTKRGIGYYFMS